MTTTYVPLFPTQGGPFTFSPELDGNVYNATVTWLLYGQRFYLNLFALDGTWVFTEAIVASPAGSRIQAASWANGRVTITTLRPHGYKLGQTLLLTVAGMTPDAYNGRWRVIVTGPATVSFVLGANPGSATAFGSLSYDINLVGGYFTSTTVVFRDGTQTFEISTPSPAAAAPSTGVAAFGPFILDQSLLGGPDVLT